MRLGWVLSASSFVLACSGDTFTPAAGGSAGGGAGAEGTAGNSGNDAGVGGASGGAGNGVGGTGGGDAGASAAGAAGNAGSGLAGAAGAGPAARVVLVSPSGDAASEGLVAASPTTLAHAVALAAKEPLEVRLCVGRYELTETLALPARIAVRGGFDCATFAQQGALGADATKRCAVDVPALRTVITGKDAVSPVLSVTSGSTQPGAATLQNVDVVGTGIAVLLAAGNPVIDESRVAIRGTSTANAIPTAAIYIDGGAAEVRRTCVLGGLGKAVAGAVEVAVAREPGSTGITMTGDATGAVRDSYVEGGSGDGNGSSHGSIALLVRNGSPIVEGTTFEGGSGKANRAGCIGSAALLVDSWNTGFSPGKSKPKLTTNRLSGGTGTQSVASGTPSVGLALLVRDGATPEQKGPGIELTRAAGTAVSGNVIHGGSGVSSAGLATFGRGVLGDGGSDQRLELLLVGNTITGREQKTTASGDGAIGVALESTRGALRENTIIGGRSLANDAFGVRIRASTGLVLENNMISGGEVQGGGVTLAAVSVDKSPQLVVRHNTLHNGMGPQVGRSRALLVTSGTAAETAGLVVDANLMLGVANGDNLAAMQLEGCNVTSLASFRDNAFLGFGDRTMRMPNATCGAFTDYDVNKLGAAITVACGVDGGKCPGGVPSTQGSAEIRSTCVGQLDPTTCIGVVGCTDLATCGPKLFQSFDSATKGLDDFVKTGGLALQKAPTLACGSLSTIATILPASIDRFGTLRTPPASRGAFEQANCP